MPRKISEEGRRVSYQDIEDLYKTKHERLVMFGCRLSRGDMDLAEDLVSSMYQKLIQRRPVLKSSLECYALTSVRNGFLDSLKRLDSRNIFLSHLDEELMDGMEEFSINPYEEKEEKVERETMKQTIRKIVSEMNPCQREVFGLCILDGLSYGEAGKVSGKSRGALKMSLQRAYFSLEENLAERGIRLNTRVKISPKRKKF